MQSVSAWIWTRVAVSVSCDDNHYTTGTSRIRVILRISFWVGVWLFWKRCRQWILTTPRVGVYKNWKQYSDRFSSLFITGFFSGVGILKYLYILDIPFEVRNNNTQQRIKWAMWWLKTSTDHTWVNAIESGVYEVANIANDNTKWPYMDKRFWIRLTWS